MRLRRVLPVGLACVILGSALYVSAGVLDRVMTTVGSVRLALLPGWPAWVAFVAVAVLAFWTLHRRLTRERPATVEGGSVAEVAGLVLAAGVLLLPYVPWLPDRLPALQVLAGPFRLVVWLLLVTQLVWVLWRPSSGVLARVRSVGLNRLAVLAGLVTFVAGAAAAVRLTATPVYPGGDEPHYLVIAQSLWRDGDLAIENNHRRGDYREYYPQDLEPHYLTRGVDGVIYSIHPVGLPVLLAPVYAAGGYPLTVVLLLGLAGMAAAWMWRWTARCLQDPQAAAFGVAAVVGSAPFLLNSFAVYPEIAAALAAVLAFTTALSLGRGATPQLACVAGVAVATLPWLSTKYAPMSAALVAVACARVFVAWPPFSLRFTRQATLAGAGVLVPYVLSVAAWFLFFHRYWGMPLPQAPYGALVQTDLKNMIFGVPGLLFDQEYGLLPYAPVYALAATGLAMMWRAGSEARRHALEVAVVGAALLATVGAFRIWWGGSASPGRPLASGLLLLVLPIASAFRAAEPGTARRAAQHLLMWTGMGVTLTLVAAQEGGLINNGRDGSSALIEFLSPLWEAWALVPSFIHHEVGTAALHALAWISCAAAAAIVLRRVKTSTRGSASATAFAVYATAVVASMLVVPLLPNDPPQPRVDLGTRARLAALDGFDRAARPVAILYDPLRVVPSDAVPPLLALHVNAGARRDRQPVRLLHNGRFSVPAGTYRVDGVWAEEPTLPSGPSIVELQLGRIGPPLERWSFDAAASPTWQRRISLPLDASFLGFRGGTDVERALARLTITPIAIEDKGTRPRTSPVLAAGRYADWWVFFHDEQSFPEPSGFWTAGGRTTSVTVASSGPASSAASLRLHPGPQPNRVKLTGYGWTQEMSVQPGAPVTVTLPESARGVVSMQIAAATGFVPSEVDPRAADRRRLGVWVEIVK